MSYRQVGLCRHNPDGGVVRTVTIIPSNLAVAGKKIELKEGDAWEGWQVETVSDILLADDVAKKIQKKYHAGWDNNI